MQPVAAHFADLSARIVDLTKGLSNMPKRIFVLIASGLIFIQPELSKSRQATQTSDKTATQQQPPNPPSSSTQIPIPASPSTAPRAMKKEAWEVLREGSKANKIPDRAAAIRVLGLLKNEERARKMAEEALEDRAPEVRSAAAAALGEMHARPSLSKLRAAIDDKDPSVVLATAHA